MKKKQKKYTKKRKQRFKHTKLKVFLIIIILLLIILGILFLIEKGIFKKHKETKINLKDECSLLFKTMIHSIKDRDNCEIRCKSQCTYEGLKYEKIKFSSNKNSCNTCECYCI